MHTRQESDEIKKAEIRKILCEISKLNDSLLGFSLFDKEQDYAIGDFHTAVENALFDIDEKFNGEI